MIRLRKLILQLKILKKQEEIKSDPTGRNNKNH